MLIEVMTVLAALCLFASLIPLLPVPHGSIRIFDFARLQILSLAGIAFVIALVAFLLPHDITARSAPLLTPSVAMAMAAAAMIIQIAYILPFTPLGPKQTARYRGELSEGPEGHQAQTGHRADEVISFLACNVKQGNRQHADVGALIDWVKADIAIFMEVDEDWAKALAPYLADMPHRVAYPQSNTYGMILASRHALKDAKVQFLLNDEVPSIACKLPTKDGREVQIVAIHPEPPVPTRDTKGRDAEILIVAEQARKASGPMIVTGDLNDVAWSRTTRRFLRISRLQDPRHGWGLFNSFDARYWFLRWPLDHIFHSKHFELVEMARLPFVGSDHFPMYYRFALVGEARNAHPPKASEDDLEEAEEIVEEEKGRGRRPAGVDWED